MELCFALIEDQSAHRELFTAAIRTYLALQPDVRIRIFMVNELRDFESILDPVCNVTAVFIDIELSGLVDERNGIALAQTLRRRGYAGELVFLTNYQDYARQGYGLDALGYLSKPCTTAILAPVIERIKSRLKPKIWQYRMDKGCLAIPYSHILYYSVNKHAVQVCTLSDTIVFRGVLKDIARTLSNDFQFCHRSYLVNVAHVRCVFFKRLWLTNNIELPVSRQYYSLLTNHISARL